MKDYEKKIFRAALRRFGLQRQMQKLNEEFHELGVLLAHDAEGRSVRRRDIAEEIADCQIMLDEMVCWYQVADEVKRQRDYKVRRLAERIGGKL